MSLILSHRKVLLGISYNEFKGRYAGSILGIGWCVFNPLIMLTVYATVYLLIFKVRVPYLSSTSYVLYIFAGLMPFLMTNEALSGGVGSIVANRAALHNVVFPIDLAPVKAVLQSQVPMIVGLVVILTTLFVLGEIRLTIFLLPVIWFFHIVGLIGLIWILSLINLVFRDLQNIIGILMFIVMVLSPIAYTPEMLPSNLKIIARVNPLAYFIIAYQKVIVLGIIPIKEMIAFSILSVTLFAVGGYFFYKAKGVFLDYV